MTPATNILPASNFLRSEHPWIAATKFEPLEQKVVLQNVLAAIEEQNNKRIQHGGKPVAVVFDLDSTIFDVKPRTLRILKEFASTEEAKSISPVVAEWCHSLKAHRLLYTLQESAAANEFPKHEKNAEQFMKAAFKFWLARFFTHEYVLTDHPTAGALDFVRAVVDRGALAIYLTGRDTPGMGRGTKTMLEHWGFPTESHHTKLVMKPSFGMDDAEFKDEALRDLRMHTEAVALFDNEPANFHVFEKNFPEASLVFLHSNCSQKPAKSVNKIYRIENFLFG